jgi:hypothetical protein
MKVMERLKEDPRASSAILRVLMAMVALLAVGMFYLPEPFNFYSMGLGLLVVLFGGLFDFLVVGPLQRKRMDELDRDLARLASHPQVSHLYELRHRLGSSLRRYHLMAITFAVVMISIALAPNRFTIAGGIVVTIVEAIILICRQK